MVRPAAPDAIDNPAGQSDGIEYSPGEDANVQLLMRVSAHELCGCSAAGAFRLLPAVAFMGQMDSRLQLSISRMMLTMPSRCCVRASSVR